MSDRTRILHYLLVHSYIYPIINPANHLVLISNLCRWLLMEGEQISTNLDQLIQITEVFFVQKRFEIEIVKIETSNQWRYTRINDRRSNGLSDLAHLPGPSRVSTALLSKLGERLLPLSGRFSPCLLFIYKDCISRNRKGQRLGLKFYFILKARIYIR